MDDLIEKTYLLIFTLGMVVVRDFRGLGFDYQQKLNSEMQVKELFYPNFHGWINETFGDELICTNYFIKLLRIVFLNHFYVSCNEKRCIL